MPSLVAPVARFAFELGSCSSSVVIGTRGLWNADGSHALILAGLDDKVSPLVQEYLEV